MTVRDSGGIARPQTNDRPWRFAVISSDRVIAEDAASIVAVAFPGASVRQLSSGREAIATLADGEGRPVTILVGSSDQDNLFDLGAGLAEHDGVMVILDFVHSALDFGCRMVHDSLPFTETSLRRLLLDALNPLHRGD